MIMTNDEKYEQIKQLTDARMKAMRGIQRMNREHKKKMNRKEKRNEMPISDHNNS